VAYLVLSCSSGGSFVVVKSSSGLREPGVERPEPGMARLLMFEAGASESEETLYSFASLRSWI
jgi:hypothetical protein